MRVGSLVKFVGSNHVGVIVGYWVHEVSKEEHPLVRWIIGRFTGDTDAIPVIDLEVLCE